MNRPNFMMEYEAPIIIWTMRGLIRDSEENKALMKETFEEGLSFHKRNRQSEIKWLNDTSELQNLGAELQGWLDIELNKRVIKERVHGKLAFVEPQDTHGKECIRLYIASAKYYFRKAHLYFEFCQFKTRGEAMSWLQQPLLLLQAA